MLTRRQAQTQHLLQMLLRLLRARSPCASNSRCHCWSALLLFGKPAIALLLQLFNQREITGFHNAPW
jgi:hypothetical protein